MNYKKEQFPSVYHDFIDIVGVANTLEIAQLFNGMNLYFPSLEKEDNAIRNGQIRREFNGSNYNELSIKYNLSDRQIRTITNMKVSNIQNVYETTDGFYSKKYRAIAKIVGVSDTIKIARKIGKKSITFLTYNNILKHLNK